MPVMLSTLEEEQSHVSHFESRVELADLHPEDSLLGPIIDDRATAGSLARTWLVGAFLSCAAIWALGAYTTDLPIPYVWDEEVERTVNAPGLHLSSREGYAWTTFGRFGLSGLADASQNVMQAGGNWVAVWGDSYVEATQVDDDQKMSRVASRLWQDQHESPLEFVGIGMAGWTIADIYFNIPKYERILGKPRMHIIVLSEVADLLPDRAEREAIFVSKPAFGFRPSAWHPKYSQVKQTMRDLRMGFVWELIRDSKDMSLRWWPGPVAPGESKSADADEKLDPAAVEFVLDGLQSHTDRPLGFIVLSRAPRLLNGRLLDGEPFLNANKVLQKACEGHGAAFATMLDSFVNFAKTEKKLPRSFQSRYRGAHLNRHGHRLVAQKIIEMVDQTLHSTSGPGHDAVHSD
jgi:hypothetical protein